MLSDQDKFTIQEIAKKYKATRIILFGSSCEPSISSNDIDLGVEGVSNHQFFKFYSELIFELSKPVDIIDITKKNSFNNIIVSEGQLIYG
ncbi:hypothetical protein KAR48_11010 [bacterium]|nr:hypothetical protein [bacterium]